MIPRNIGELKTRVRVQFAKSIKTPNDTSARNTWIDIGNNSDTNIPKYKYCLWVGVHGNEAFKLAQEVASELATLTFRYDERINTSCVVVYKGSVYQIISVNHVKQERQWTEIKIKRGVPS